VCAAPPTSERSSQQPGGTPQRSANDNTTRAQTSTTATQQGSISANPFQAIFNQVTTLVQPAFHPPVYFFTQNKTKNKKKKTKTKKKKHHTHTPRAG
jgi:hypothetical protein